MTIDEPPETMSPTATSRGSFEIIEVGAMSFTSAADITELVTPSEHVCDHQEHKRPQGRSCTENCLGQLKEAPSSTSFLEKVKILRDEVSLTQPELLEALQGYIRNASNDTDLEVPSWFRNHCVKTAAELKERKHSLSIRRDYNELFSSPMGCDNPEVHEMDAVVYDPIQSILHTPNKHAPNWSSVFKYDAVYLRYPTKDNTSKSEVGIPPHPPPPPPTHSCRYDVPPPPPPPPMPLPNGTSIFLSLVVEQFAKDSQADLITLTLEDLKDLAAHFAREQGEPVASDYATVRQFFGLDNDDENAGHHTYPGGQFFLPPPPMTPRPRTRRYHTGPPLPPMGVVTTLTCLPLTAILQSALEKNSSSASSSEASRNPLVVHMPNAQDLLRTLGSSWLSVLQKELVKLREARISVVLIFTSPEHTDKLIWPETTVMSTAGTQPMAVPLYVAPTKSASQTSLFSRHQAKELSHAPSNLRKLQYAMRQVQTGCIHQMLLPYSLSDLWELEDAPNSWTERQLTSNDVETLVHSIGGRCDGEIIRKEIQAFYHRQEVLKPWWPALKEYNGGGDSEQDEALTQHPSKWSKFPKHVQKVVKQIETEQHAWTYERSFLDTLVNLQVICQSSITMDPDIKASIVKQIYRFFGGRDAGTSLLQQARIGGALLYGPPGTGKTQMARILARECEIAMLSISIADIERYDIRETARHIQALFNLARMLYPCVIFIDDADAMFHARQLDTHELGRSRIVQMLAEMDKAPEMGSAPFMVLATSLPTHLDRAVLRRVPSFLHVGLPSASVREKIFNIYLRDEVLDRDVKIPELATLTAGFSGCDIKTLCMQAVLLREPDTRNRPDVQKLRREHFLNAFKSVRPSISQAALEEIRAFAAQYDPVVLEQL